MWKTAVQKEQQHHQRPEDDEGSTSKDTKMKLENKKHKKHQNKMTQFIYLTYEGSTMTRTKHDDKNLDLLKKPQKNKK